MTTTRTLRALLICCAVGLCVTSNASASRWAVTRLPGGDRVVPSAVSCASVRLCVAMGDFARVWATGNPTAGGSSWTTGVALTKVRPDLGTVSCPTDRFCVAATVGEGKGIIASTSHPLRTASPWHQAVPSEGVAAGGLDCASTSFCALADNPFGLILTSNRPGGPGAGWRSSGQLAVGAWKGLSCPTSRFCAAIDQGNVATSNRPAGSARAWRIQSLRRGGRGGRLGLTGVSCPSASFCAVVGSGLPLFTTADPTGSGRRWKTTRIGISGTARISCASKRTCVAVDRGGYVHSSRNPAGGARAWSRSHIARSLLSVSCPTAKFCVAVGYDEAGKAVVAVGAP